MEGHTEIEHQMDHAVAEAIAQKELPAPEDLKDEDIPELRRLLLKSWPLRKIPAEPILPIQCSEQLQSQIVEKYFKQSLAEEDVHKLLDEVACDYRDQIADMDPNVKLILPENGSYLYQLAYAHISNLKTYHAEVYQSILDCLQPWDGRVLDTCSLYSGILSCHVYLAAWFEAFFDISGVKVTLNCVFLCELDDTKREIAMENCPGIRYAFGDARNFLHRKEHLWCYKQRKYIPMADLWGAAKVLVSGFTCAGASSLKENRKDLARGISETKGPTGEAGQATISCAELTGCTMVFLENVPYPPHPPYARDSV